MPSGLVATIVWDQSTIFSKAYGKDARGKPPTMQSYVHIASITKTFTSQLLFKLRDAGLVHLDDPVSKYFPDFAIHSPFRTTSPMTLRQLATHTSGIPRDLPYPCGFGPQACNETGALAMLSNMHLVVPPYTRFHYSNIGSALLGRTLEKAAGKPYDTLLQREILTPLGINGTTIIDSASVAKMAVGVLPD